MEGGPEAVGAGLSNGKGGGRERYGKKEAERQDVCLRVCVCVRFSCSSQ